MSARPVLQADVLVQILDELRGIRRALERRHAPDTTAEKLLEAIHAHAGARPFGASELIRHACLAGAAELREAIGGMNARQLGRALRRIEGRELGGLILFRDGEDRTGLVWRVSRVSNSQNSWVSASGRKASITLKRKA